MTRDEKILKSAEEWIGFYRENIHRIAEDYLHVSLRLFQKINLYEMDNNTNFVYIASRGQGKTYLLAIFCCCRAILYPGTKIVIASGTRGQAINVLEKIITELKPNSPELEAEIDEKGSKMNGTNAILQFKNGSFCKVVTSGESARGNRAHILIMDEFRLIPKDTIDTILRHFLASEREPPYSELTFDERMAEKRKDKERNRMLWSSSAYFQDSWAYDKCKDTFRFMLQDGRRDFICGLPYQLAVQEQLLREDDVLDQMDESDFSEVKWAMEMGAEFWGSGDGSFFDYNAISKNRKIRYPMLPNKLAAKLGNSQMVKIDHKKNGNIRILSADIALMSSKKNNNDATAVFVNEVIPTKSGKYTSNIIYCDSYEGLRTDKQALAIRRLFDEYECDYIVLDTNGLGIGVFDCLASDINDPDNGEIYPALSCCNDKTMADRCTVQGAEKAIWSIKASAQLNSDIAFLLREGFRSGKIRLLVSEYDAEDALGEIRGYGSLSPADKVQLSMPYINTTLLIDELVNLQHDEQNGRVKIHEKSNMRKDRYSSLAYNFYVASQLEAKHMKRNALNSEEKSPFIIKAPVYKGRR